MYIFLGLIVLGICMYGVIFYESNKDFKSIKLIIKDRTSKIFNDLFMTTNMIYSDYGSEYEIGINFVDVYVVEFIGGEYHIKAIYDISINKEFFKKNCMVFIGVVSDFVDDTHYKIEIDNDIKLCIVKEIESAIGDYEICGKLKNK